MFLNRSDPYIPKCLILDPIKSNVRRRKRGSNEKLSRTKDATLARKDSKRTSAILGRKRRQWKSLSGQVAEDDPPEDVSVRLAQGDSDTEAWEYLDHIDAPTVTSYYERLTGWLFSVFRGPLPSRAFGKTS